MGERAHRGAVVADEPLGGAGPDEPERVLHDGRHDGGRQAVVGAEVAEVEALVALVAHAERRAVGREALHGALRPRRRPVGHGDERAGDEHGGQQTAPGGHGAAGSSAATSGGTAAKRSVTSSSAPSPVRSSSLA